MDDILGPGERLLVKGAAAFWRIVSLRLTPGLLLPLAILSGFLTLGNYCGGYPSDITSRAPQWTPDGNHIVFEHRDSNRGNRASIYVVRADGSDLKRIPPGGEDRDGDYRPDISPNGSRIVYTTTRHKTKLRGQWQYENEIETSKLDGSDRRRLTYHDVGQSIPAWSPDGTRIAFSSKHDIDGPYIGQVVVMEADGSNKRIVFDSETFDLGVIGLKQGSAKIGGSFGRPVWSPNGETMSFVGAAFGKNRVGEYVYDNPFVFLFKAGADGQGLMPLVVSNREKGAVAGEKAWSPDGRELAFLQYDPAAGELGKWILYAIGHDGSGLRKVSELDYRGRFSSLSWSPNGDEILVVSDGDLYVAKADGSGYREVAQAPYASWSPDGSRIAISGGSGFYLTTIAADGSDEQVLVYEYTDSSLGAANPEPKKCFLWICW